jgi:hypothetical protein
MADLPPSPRAQFGLRWLFALTAAVAVCAFVYRQSGRDEAVGVAIAFGLLAIGLVVKQRRWLRRTAFVAAGLSAWIATVDYVMYLVKCDRCYGAWIEEEVRVLHQPIWSRSMITSGSSVFPLIAEDLGAPCPHQMKYHTLRRFWGFIWPRTLRSDIIVLPMDRSRYDKGMREHVRNVGAADRALAQRFQSALENHDFASLGKYTRELRELATEKGYADTSSQKP